MHRAHTSKLYTGKDSGVGPFYHQWVDKIHSLLPFLKHYNTHGKKNPNFKRSNKDKLWI